MAKYQTDYNLTEDETQMIVDYLNALTGDIPEK
jgi:hypothetical protein